mmetsp:Transcript_3469/g.7232  ORF Transcript_3469/g.7232 Transcript_3469/m.7232 type:complete len:88 (-) Transcript_3469:181-444(-)
MPEHTPRQWKILKLRCFQRIATLQARCSAAAFTPVGPKPDVTATADENLLLLEFCSKVDHWKEESQVDELGQSATSQCPEFVCKVQN